MKTLLTCLFGLGILCPVVAQIKTSQVEIDLFSSTTVDSNFTPETNNTRSLGTSALQWSNVFSYRILAGGGGNTGFGFEADGTYLGKHWITANDGGGNINIRFANKFTGGAHTQTESGLAMHMLWDNSDGQFHWKSTESSNSPGSNIGSLFRTFVQISPMNKLWHFPLSDWKIRSEAPFDGPKIQTDIITNRAGSGGPAFPNGLTSDGDIAVSGNITIAEKGYLDDDDSPGGLDDDFVRLNGFIEMRSANPNHGIVLRDKVNTAYLSITQHDGSSYFADSRTYTEYFLRGNGANAFTRGDMYVEGDDLYSNSGALRLNGEDDVRIAMDYNNNDNNTRKILFGKNDEGLAENWVELMRIEEAGNVVVGSGGTLQVNTITNSAGSGKPVFTEGLTANDDVVVTGKMTATTVEATSVIKLGSSQIKKLSTSSGAPGGSKDIIIHASNAHVQAEVTLIGLQTNTKNEDVYWHGIVTYDNSYNQIKAMTIASSKMSATALVSGGNVVLRITDNSQFGYNRIRGSVTVHP